MSASSSAPTNQPVRFDTARCNWAGLVGAVTPRPGHCGDDDDSGGGGVDRCARREGAGLFEDVSECNAMPGPADHSVACHDVGPVGITNARPVEGPCRVEWAWKSPTVSATALRRSLRRGDASRDRNRVGGEAPEGRRPGEHRVREDS
jgi:hypothetical protein